ncbi:DUF2304 domain-containing protein [Kineococcus rubinsiae]|uniref:DUF2304 domain-containing protein n=1 Tax=Kineococcus rubinsiae TaxID=2609562 RepID=UPI001431FE54|nr:DUF2304 domain-containing protein [Kineococcus rubinsiae]NIZ91536.1 DUF2304 domain-containing protein [Kineococcus rubinsiae]
MLLIQGVLVVALLVVGAVLVRSTSDVRHQAVRRILLVLLGVLAVTSVLVPGAVTWVAEKVGVGRGTDLVLYGLVVAFLGFIASSYRRTRVLESKVAELTRRLALDEEARERGVDGPGNAGRPGA